MENKRRIYIITGASSGLGRAFASLVLHCETTSTVVGIARSNPELGDRYTHQLIDLSTQEGLQAIEWPDVSSFDEVVLVSNAATIGDLKPVGELNTAKIERDIFLNTTAPLILMNEFYRVYKSSKASKVIINISSGAANYAIESWSMYCSSKAAVNAMSEVFAQELRTNEVDDTLVFAIAPGIIDTGMQKIIRSTDEEDFPDVKRFQEYHDNQELDSPEEVAKKLYFVVEQANHMKSVAFSLRDVMEPTA